MKKATQLLQELLGGLKSAHANTIRLFLITRHLKEGISKSKKMLDKYDFKTSKIDLSPDLQEYFKDVQIAQVAQTLENSDLEVLAYSVVDDDLQNKVYTCALNNALSFAEVVNVHLPNSSRIKTVTSLKDIRDNLWAYCIRTTVSGDPVYSFRKIGRGKIITHENDKNMFQKIQCAFNTQDAKLELLQKETMSLDEKIDCIYFGSQFFVLKKGSFETMVGLEDEFRETATTIINELRTAVCAEGITFMETEATQSKLLLRRLAHIAASDNYKNLDGTKIKKMQRTAKRFGDNLRISDDKVLIENGSDLRVFMQVLSDYYKQGEITGNYYGSNSGKLLQPVEEQ